MATKNSALNPVATPDMMNAIRAEASDAYQRAVPLATASNLADVGNPIMSYQAVGNEFVDALINKIVYTMVYRQMFENPLAFLRTGEMPLGFDIENVHVNPAEAEKYDGTETGMADILKMHEPDVATEYFRINRQDKYPVTINNEQLRHAFTSWGAMENLIATITDSLYNGNAIDEFLYTKQLVSGAIAANRIQTQTIAEPISDPTGAALLKLLRTLSTMFTFPSSTYNNYKLAGGTGNARITWTPIDEQIILIRGDVASAVGVDTLARVFNTEYADYLARQIIVDDFGAATNVMAVLADRKAFVIQTQLRQFATFYNASTLGWQYYYHAWDLFAMSAFRNAVAIVKPAAGG